MIRRIILAFMIANTLNAMDGESASFLELSLLDLSFVYIGKNPSRSYLESQYGRTFSLNTIFLRVRFNGESADQEEMPDYVCYEDVKDGQEGQLISLMIDGHAHTVRCKQKWHCYEKLFQERLCEKFEAFKRKPDAPYWGIMSLVEAKIIGVSSQPGQEGLVQHGEHGSPLVLDSKNS